MGNLFRFPSFSFGWSSWWAVVGDAAAVANEGHRIAGCVQLADAGASISQTVMVSRRDRYTVSVWGKGVGGTGGVDVVFVGEAGAELGTIGGELRDGEWTWISGEIGLPMEQVEVVVRGRDGVSVLVDELSLATIPALSLIHI